MLNSQTDSTKLSKPGSGQTGHTSVFNVHARHLHIVICILFATCLFNASGKLSIQKGPMPA